MISYQISQLRVPGAGMRLQPGRRLNKTAVMTFVSCQCASERRKAFGCKMGCQERGEAPARRRDDRGFKQPT